MARATDRAGYTGSPDSVKVYVDDKAPVLAAAPYGLVGLEKSGEGPNSWVVPLSGGVTDPSLTAGIPGQRRAGRRRAGGGPSYPRGRQPLGSGQAAAVSGGSWSLDYEIDEADRTDATRWRS